MASKPTMSSVMGQAYVIPATPSPSRMVSAASGPYAAEANASSPSIGTPATVPTLRECSSAVASGRPKNQSNTAIASFPQANSEDRHTHLLTHLAIPSLA
jgi:hypothetical protein